MNKSWITVLLLSAATILFSCKSGESEYHYTAFIYPVPDQSLVYADQTVDSIKFFTLDNWKLTSSTSWAKLPDDPAMNSGVVPAGYSAAVVIPVYFEANSTGQARTALFSLMSYDRTLATSFTQTPCHNVLRPAMVDSLKAFAAIHTSAAVHDSIVFVAHSPWTLMLDDSDQSWVKTGTPLEGEAGRHIILYDVEPLVGTDSRKAQLKLQGAGVTTVIEIAQKKK